MRHASFGDSPSSRQKSVWISENRKLIKATSSLSLLLPAHLSFTGCYESISFPTKHRVWRCLNIVCEVCRSQWWHIVVWKTWCCSVQQLCLRYTNFSLFYFFLWFVIFKSAESIWEASLFCSSLISAQVWHLDVPYYLVSNHLPRITHWAFFSPYFFCQTVFSVFYTAFVSILPYLQFITNQNNCLPSCNHTPVFILITGCSLYSCFYSGSR